MAKYAVIKNGVVDNVVLAETQEIAEEVTGFTCIEVEHVPGAPGIGWSYSGTTFTAPIVEETSAE
jgi:hypothetical protein